MNESSRHRSDDLVFGKHAVAMTLETEWSRAEKLWVQKGMHLTGRLDQVIRHAVRAGVVIQYVDRQSLDRLTVGASHQGFVLRISPITFVDLRDWLQSDNTNDSRLVILLDGIQDPGNIGAIFRSAAAANVNAIVIPRRGTAPLGGTAMKASAGTLMSIPVIKVANVRNALQLLKKHRFFVTGMSEKVEMSIVDMPQQTRHVLVFGSEDRGLRLINRSECDELRSIPMTGPAGSLNVSASVAVVLYERMRAQLARDDKIEKKLDFRKIRHRLPDAD